MKTRNMLLVLAVGLAVGFIGCGGKEEANKAQDALEKARSELDKIKTDMAEMKESFLATEKNLGKARSELAAAKSEMDGKLAEAKKAQEEAEKSLTDAKIQLKEQEEEIKRLKTDNAPMRTQLKLTQAMVTEAKGERDNLAKENIRLQKTIKSQAASIVQLKKQLQAEKEKKASEPKTLGYWAF